MDERTAMVTIGGVEYEMLLTTRATKQIAGRYGGLENLGEKLMKERKAELAAEEVELLTSPMELTDYKDAIMEAMYRGTKRNVESEPEGKNTAAG